MQPQKEFDFTNHLNKPTKFKKNSGLNTAAIVGTISVIFFFASSFSTQPKQQTKQTTVDQSLITLHQGSVKAMVTPTIKTEQQQLVLDLIEGEKSKQDFLVKHYKAANQANKGLNPVQQHLITQYQSDYAKLWMAIKKEMDSATDKAHEARMNYKWQEQLKELNNHYDMAIKQAQ